MLVLPGAGTAAEQRAKDQKRHIAPMLARPRIGKGLGRDAARVGLAGSGNGRWTAAEGSEGSLRSELRDRGPGGV